MADHDDRNATAAYAREQRDISRRAGDEWLSRMILAVLAGNGASLIALANLHTVVGGPILIRLAGFAAALFFLFGISTAFLSLVSRRIHHIGRESLFDKRLQELDLGAHLTDQEMRTLMKDDVTRAAGFAMGREADAERYLTRAMWASIFGVVILVAAVLFATPQPTREAPNEGPAADAGRREAGSESPRNPPAR